jgi:two-component system chemotaxis response regulator CheV
MATGTSGILLESGTNELEIIELFIEEEGYRGYYGVNVAKVLEIIHLPDKVIKPPNAAPFVSGVFDHRGKVIMLVDLAKWLGRKRIASERPAVLITEFNQVTTSFLVSGVTRIHRTFWSNIKPLGEYLQGFSSVLTGVVLLEGRTVFMLDLERVLGDLEPRLAMPLPEKDAAEAWLQDTGLPEAAPAVEPAGQWKVLHADDSAMIRRATKTTLEDTKEFTVTPMVDGRVAWDWLAEMKMLSQSENRPITDYVDIVLTDIEMPEMDGYSLCAKIKGDPELKALPVVLFSSLITDKLMHKGESVGADKQLAKPRPHELIAAVRELVSAKRP